MEPKLIPCPFCESTDIRFMDDLQGNEAGHQEQYYRYWCGNCGCFGPNEITPIRAQQFWNLRRPMKKVHALAQELLNATRENLYG